MIREFYIENETGQRFSMMNIESGCFLSSPNGLGYSYDIEYAQIGDNFIQNIRKLTQGQISGELIFKTYDKYKEFVDFIESAVNLKFVYKIPLKKGTIEYFKDIDISSVEKSEIGTDGVLRVPVIFNCKSLWYEAKEVVYTIDSIDNEVRWNFDWDSIFTAYDNRNIIFENKGHAAAPFKLELNGEVSGPVITILEDDIEVNKLSLDGLVVLEGETFVYNTKETEQEITKVSSTERTNLFNFLNPNFVNFFKLRKGASTIRLEADGEITSGKITIYVQYKAV